MPAAPGSRPDRRAVEQIDDAVPVVPLLHTFVPQRVDQLVEVLRLIETVVPEQVIDVPKITSQDVIPQRAVLREPQMAEKLLDEPVPCLDDFALVEVGEEEDEHPQVVPGSRVRDAYGHAWCRVVGPAGGLLVAYWHFLRPVDPSGGDHRQARAERNTGRRGGSGG